MNPFFALLIGIPLLGAIIIFLGTLVGLARHGLQLDIAVSMLISVAIGGYLVYFLKKSSNPQGALLKFTVVPGLDELKEQTRQWITSALLAITYIVLGLLSILLFQINSIKNLVGVAAFLLGGASLYSAFRSYRFSNHSALLSKGLAEMVLESTRKARNYVLVSHSLLAVYFIWAYNYSGGAGYFSLIDLAGALFLLFASAAWFIVRVKTLESQSSTLPSSPVH